VLPLKAPVLEPLKALQSPIEAFHLHEDVAESLQKNEEHQPVDPGWLVVENYTFK
jgi:hypothetical protein